MNRVLLIVSLSLVLAGCAGKPVVVNYNAPEPSVNDWFPIPNDAPNFAQVGSPKVSRITPYIAPAIEADPNQALRVDWLLDSVGNATLLLNRQSGTAWELVETALADLNIELADKNRDEYRFELAQAKGAGGLLNVFRTKQKLNIILFPRGNSTVVAVEGKDEVLPEASVTESILQDIANQLQVKS